MAIKNQLTYAGCFMEQMQSSGFTKKTCKYIAHGKMKKSTLGLQSF